MDAELERKLAALLDGDAGAENDPAVMALFNREPKARVALAEMLQTDRDLKAWPAPAGAKRDWDSFARDIEHRLGEDPAPKKGAARASNSFDPFAPPLPDEADSAPVTPEHRAMSKDDKHDDEDLEGLAALMRPGTASSAGKPSMPPPAAVPSVRPGPALADDAMDESSGIVDIKMLAAVALRQSVPPPAEELKADDAEKAKADQGAKTAVPAANEAEAAETKAPSEKKSEKKPSKSEKGDKSEKAAPVKAAEPEEKKSSPMVWLFPLGIAAAVGLTVVVMKNQQQATPPTVAQANTASPSGSAESAPASPSAAPVVAAAAPAPAPVAAPAAPAEPPAAPPPAPAAPEPAAAAQGGAAPAAVAVNDNAPGGSGASADRAARSSEGSAASGGSGGSRGSRSSGDGEGSRSADRGSRSGGSSEGGGSRSAANAPAPPPPPAAAPPPPPPAAAGGRPSVAEVLARGTGQAPAGGQGAPPPAGGRPRSMDELMRNVVHGNEAPPPPAAAAAAVPPRLASAQVRGVMTPLAGAVRACTQGATGQALVALTLVSDGTVQNASVSGPFTPTVRTCIEGVVRRAHFPRFSSPTQQVAYPFTIAAGG